MRENVFIDTDETLGGGAFVDDEFDWKKHTDLVIKLKKDGYVYAPGWMPIGLAGYQWEFPDYIESLMKPAPTFWHVIRYGLTWYLTPEWFTRWQARRWLKSVLPEAFEKKEG